MSDTFRQCKRIIRDIERTTGKSIELGLTGQNTRLDRNIVDNLAEPLVHIIRNACDHGIEPKDVRKAKGKPETGRINIKAYEEGNSVHITIQDDGQGLDHKRIQEIASELGLTTKGQVLTTRQSQELIFTPGFSTANELTKISGRGLGMDIIRKKIDSIKGSIGIESLSGKGTTIDIRVPLTLAVSKALIVKDENEIFAIPVDAILRSIRINPDEVQHHGDRRQINYQGRPIPLQSLQQAILPDLAKKRSLSTKEHLYILILKHKDQPFGIVVDQLLNHAELINKPLSNLLGSVSCASGAAIMSNGDVAIIVDPTTLYKNFSKTISAA
jgi:two-component system chemotaxis sensor kinase CheA